MVEGFAGTNFCDFANVLVIPKCLYPQNGSVQVFLESLYHGNFPNFRFYHILAECVPVKGTTVVYVSSFKSQDLQNHLEAFSMATELSGSF